MNRVYVILFLYFYILSFVKSSNGDEEARQRAVMKYERKASSYVNTVGGIVEGFTAAKYNPGLKYGLASGRALSKSTQAGVVNSVGQWVFRLDKPHGKMKYSHININHRLTGVRDPHIRIPDGLVTAGSTASNAIQTVSEGLGYLQLAVDGYRLVSAIHEDMTSDTSSGKTIKTAASIGGGTLGGYTGAYAGSSVGGYIGGGVGFLFGGFGAVPGAALGSMVGGFFGAVLGSGMGRSIAEEATK